MMLPQLISLGFPNEPLGGCRNRVGEPMTYRVSVDNHLVPQREEAPHRVVDAWSEISGFIYSFIFFTYSQMHMLSNKTEAAYQAPLKNALAGKSMASIRYMSAYR
jgi:hypothetical protein